MGITTFERVITSSTEGIESEEELAVAEQIGIHLVQGYLFGKPASLTTHQPGFVGLSTGTS